MDLSTAKQGLSTKFDTLTSGTLLIEGPTLVGKTKLIEQVKELLERKNDVNFVQIISCSQSYSGYEPILDAIEELAKQENWLLRKRISRLLGNSGGHIFTFIAGIFHKFFPEAVPKESIEQIRSGLDSILKANKETAIVLEFSRAETSKLLKTFEKVVKKSGRHLFLFIDRLEELPTQGIKLLQLLAESPLSNIVIILSANSESPAYFQRKDIRELTNICKKNNDSVAWQIEGYLPSALFEMKRAGGYKVDMSSATKAYECSLDGRIGLACDWLNSDKEDVDIFRPGADKLSAYYAIHYERLEEEYKNLIKCLGVIYPSGLNIYCVAKGLQCQIMELEIKLRNVLGSFAVLVNDTVTLKNKHILFFLRSQIGPVFMQAAYESILNGSTAIAPPIQEISAPMLPFTSASKQPISLITMDAQTLLVNTRADLARGASQSAISRIDAWREWKGNETQDPDIETEMLLLESDALGQLGVYDLAIEKLKRMPSVTVEASISLGEKYFREGQHKLALDRLAYARRQSRIENKLDAWLKATARTLSVRNEMRSGSRSVKLANYLAKLLATDGDSMCARDRCLAYRTLARTFVLIPSSQAEALVCAIKALEIADNEIKSARDEGNARYALADVYRHLGKMDKAIVEYKKAKGLSSTNSNLDLELYALLGMAACYIKQGDVRQLDSILNELEHNTNYEALPEKKIIALFRMAQKKIDNKEIFKIADSSAVTGRPWTYNMVKSLATPIDTFGQLLIVL